MTSQSYAVIRAGGKQIRVAPGERIKIEKIDQAPGEEVQFPEVLLLKEGEATKAGQPLVEGAAVTGEVLRHGRARKALVFKKKPKKGTKKMYGHRQYFSEVLIKTVGSNVS